MIVCHCTGITDRDIRSLVRGGGAKTAREIGRDCSAGNQCGGCRQVIAQIVLQEERARGESLLSDLVPAL